MEKIIGFIGMTVGGWIGWLLGDLVSFFTAFMVSIVGTGLGLYAARKFCRNYLP